MTEVSIVTTTHATCIYTGDPPRLIAAVRQTLADGLWEVCVMGLPDRDTATEIATALVEQHHREVAP